MTIEKGPSRPDATSLRPIMTVPLEARALVGSVQFPVVCATGDACQEIEFYNLTIDDATLAGLWRWLVPSDGSPSY